MKTLCLGIALLWAVDPLVEPLALAVMMMQIVLKLSLAEETADLMAAETEPTTAGVYTKVRMLDC
jgi:hypothetical protein